MTAGHAGYEATMENVSKNFACDAATNKGIEMPDDATKTANMTNRMLHIHVPKTPQV